VDESDCGGIRGEALRYATLRPGASTLRGGVIGGVIGGMRGFNVKTGRKGVRFDFRGSRFGTKLCLACRLPRFGTLTSARLTHCGVGTWTWWGLLSFCVAMWGLSSDLSASHLARNLCQHKTN
jgi:hypothetical protein